MLGLQEFPSTWMVLILWWHGFPQIIGVSNDHLGSAWWIAISCLELSTGLYTYLIATSMHNCSWCTAQVLHWVIGENMARATGRPLQGGIFNGEKQIFPTIFGCGWAGGATTTGTRNGGWSTVVTRHNASRWLSGAGTSVALNKPAGCFGFLKGWNPTQLCGDYNALSYKHPI